MFRSHGVWRGTNSVYGTFTGCLPALGPLSALSVQEPTAPSHPPLVTGADPKVQSGKAWGASHQRGEGVGGGGEREGERGLKPASLLPAPFAEPPRSPLVLLFICT